MTDFDTIQPQNFASRDKFKRIGQREILPYTVKRGHLGDIFLLTNVATISATLSNGDAVTITNTVLSSVGAKLMTVFETSIYVNSVVTANKLPGGSNITHSQWQVIFPLTDYASSDGKNIKTLVYVRNISAGASVPIIFYTRSRAISSFADIS